MATELETLCDLVDSRAIDLRQASDEELEAIIELCKRVVREEAERERG